MIGGGNGGGAPKGQKYSEVTRARPCPVCGADSWCSTFERGVKCMRCSAGADVVRTDDRGQEYGLYFTGAIPRGYRPPAAAEPPPAPIAPEPARAAVYLAMLYALTLSPAHRDQLLRRGLDAREIDLREYRSLTHPADRTRALDAARSAAAKAGVDLDTVPGFYRGGIVGASGLLIPVRDAGASILAFKVRRDLTANDQGSKYVWFSSRSEARPDGPSPGALTHVPLVSLRPAVTLPAGELGVLRVTEGPLKADIATAITGVRTVGIPGASIIRDVVALARALQPRAVRLAWDSDAAVPPVQREPAADGPAAGRSIRRRNHVALSLEQCAHALARELPDVAVEMETWPTEGHGGAKGIDDALMATARAPITVHRDEGAWIELHRVVTAGGETPGAATCERAGLAPPAPPTAPPAPAAPGAAADPNDHRPRIVVESRVSDRVSAYTRRTPTTDLARAGLAALAQTSWGDRIFALEGSNPPCMVHVVAESADAEHGHLARASVVGTTKSVLRGWMSGAARWIFEGGGRSGNETVEADPPESVVCFARESCEGVRPLRGLVEAPVMRRDGTIIATPGYDPATRLFAAFDADAAARALAAIPDAPTQADACAALDILHKLVCDFPFEKTSHRATWVAGLLTMLAREMFDGPAPLFLARANTRGSGKTLLTELPHIIACGDRPAMLGWSGDEQEFEKQVTTEAIAGSSCVVIDNITGTFKSATLDRILTSGKHRARILGGNQKFDGPMRAVWWGSGNNLDTSDDMASRRIAPIELVATDARPEDRTGFAADSVEGDAAHGGSGETGTAALRALALRRRWEYVAAAMTILRAWHCAGRPDGGLPAWGSFESWSRVVRGALVFAGDVDPGDAHMEFRDSASVDTAQLRGLLEGWMDAVDTRLVSPSGEPLKRVVDRIVAEARDAAQRKETPRGVMLREALEGITSETLEKWSSKTAGFIGKWLRSRKAKVATTDRGPRAFDVAGESGGSARWQIVQPAAPIGRTDEAADDPGRGERGVEGDTTHRSALTCVHARDLSPLRPCMRIETVGDIPPNTPLPPATSPSDGVRNSRTGQAVPMSFDDGDMVPDDTTPPEHGFGDDSEGA